MASEGRGDAGVVVAFSPRGYRQLVGLGVLYASASARSCLDELIWSLWTVFGEMLFRFAQGVSI